MKVIANRGYSGGVVVPDPMIATVVTQDATVRAVCTPADEIAGRASDSITNVATAIAVNVGLQVVNACVQRLLNHDFL